MGKLRIQFITLLLTVITLFFGVVTVDLYFFGRMTSLYRLETKVALVFLNWNQLVAHSSGYILSNETVGQAYITWKKEYDAYKITWKRDVDELDKLAGGDDVLAGQITWVRETIDLGVEQMDLMDKYLGDFISDLRLHQPDIIDRSTMASLSFNQNNTAILSAEDEFYLNKVRDSSHFLGDMMSPAIVTSQTRFQNQIADRIQTINDQLTRIRLLFITLILVVLIAFLIRIIKLNFDLFAMLEDRVRARTAELEAANKELEAFAYSVSHDLRAPLRHIDGFLELLQTRTTATLDEKSQHYMATIADSARRMGVLIDDLLSFSRMGRNEISKAQLDLGELVQDVIREFRPEAAGRDIQWNLPPLPLVTGDRAMLRIVLVNLISNALKFTRSRSPAVIEISRMSGEDGMLTVFIRDNGVGFDMNYVGKLFGVFQRLHRADEFEGTGIGLANVQRIIRRHGGETWAEGKVDQGATFYFSLPQSKMEA